MVTNDNSIFTDPTAFRCSHCGNLVRKADAYGIYCSTDCSKLDRQSLVQHSVVETKFVIQRGYSGATVAPRLWHDLEWTDTRDKALLVKSRYDESHSKPPYAIHRVIRRDTVETLIEDGE